MRPILRGGAPNFKPPRRAEDGDGPDSDLGVELYDVSRRAALAARAAAARDETGRNFAQERGAWLQQKVALQAGRRALEGELAKIRSQLAAAIDLRAQKDSQIAQLRAEIEESARQFESLRHDLLRAEQQAIEITQCIASLCEEIGELRRVNRGLAAEREACLARRPGARLRALWQHLAGSRRMPFSVRPARRAAPARPD